MNDLCSPGRQKPSLDDLRAVAQSVGAVVVLKQRGCYEAVMCHAAKSHKRPLMTLKLPLELRSCDEYQAIVEALTLARDSDLLTANEEGLLCRAKGCGCSGVCSVH